MSDEEAATLHRAVKGSPGTYTDTFPPIYGVLTTYCIQFACVPGSRPEPKARVHIQQDEPTDFRAYDWSVRVTTRYDTYPAPRGAIIRELAERQIA